MRIYLIGPVQLVVARWGEQVLGVRSFHRSHWRIRSQGMRTASSACAGEQQEHTATHAPSRASAWIGTRKIVGYGDRWIVDTGGFNQDVGGELDGARHRARRLLYSPEEAKASSSDAAGRRYGRSFRWSGNEVCSNETCSRSWSTTELCPVTARTTRSIAKFRQVPQPSPAPSRLAAASANEEASSDAGRKENSEAASTSCRSVTQLHRQTYMARPIRQDGDKL